MNNNFFLLYHNTNFETADETLLLNFQDDNFDQIAALIVSLTQEKLQSFLELEAFKKLCKKIIINGFLDASTLFEFCSIVFNRLANSPQLTNTYIEVFNYLHAQELVTNQEKSKLLSIFEPLLPQIEHETSSSDFKHTKDALYDLIDQVQSVCDSQSIEQNLQNVKTQLMQQSFSIGITGVMNVGKSTFINAMLGEELLGSAVVAETANLSVIQYASEPFTKVRFFNKLEFDEMLHTFEDDEQRDAYLKQIQQEVQIEKFIFEKALVKDIQRDQLPNYTSAAKSSGLSHLVRDVQIGVDLDFLKDSIEIVDTPGLDDSLIVRESITQGYVANCDLLIHLMNVNQSATQKDVDFLLDAVLKQDVSSILILLTKADNITKKELEEVIRYTKTSIENQLLLLGDDKNVTRVLSSLKFLSISAKTALEIRKAKKEDKEKDLLEQSGILQVEAWLHETLFSNNAKNEMIVDAAKRKLHDIIESQLKIYHYNMVLYSKGEEELENELQKFNQVKEQNNAIYEKIQKQIQKELESFKEHLASLDNDMSKEINQLQSKLLGRISDEVRYTLKNAQTLKEHQLKMIIEKSLNHGFIDIVRDHKYKLEKKVEAISKDIEQSFYSNNIQVDSLESSFSMQELFEKNSSSIFHTSTIMILKHMLELAKTTKLSKMEHFEQQCAHMLQEEFIFVNSHLIATISELNENVIESFFEVLQMPLQRLKEELQEYESSLEKQIYFLQDKDLDVEVMQIQTQEKMNLLGNIQKSLL